MILFKEWEWSEKQWKQMWSSRDRDSQFLATSINGQKINLELKIFDESGKVVEENLYRLDLAKQDVTPWARR